jgi:hypothetical protein
MKLLITLTAMLLAAGSAHASPYLFSMGASDAPLWSGFARVTVDSVFSDSAGFGWQRPEGLKAYHQAHRAPVENGRRGAEEPPPIWTNAITESTIVGDRESTFLIHAAPGDYDLYLVCGTSVPFRDQYFDFTVRVGDQQQRVQVEGGFQFRSLRFHAAVGREPLAIHFTPRSKWLVNTIMAWTPLDAARVQREVIAPFEQWTYRLPPEEEAKWKEEPEPEPGPMPPVSAADQQRGFVLYSRHYLECIYPHTRPRVEEMNPELRLFASWGEYEACNFIVYSLKDLTGARVTVSRLGPVPARNIEVRHVRFMRARPNYTVMYRYRIVPDILERFETLDLKAGENARFWLTVHVPDDAPAGIYRGKATFECSGGKAEVPIRLRILPIRLREDPSKLYGIYYRHPYDQMASATDAVSKAYFRRKAELEHQDMVAHGTRSVVLSLWSPPADEQGRFKLDWDLLAAKLDLWRKYHFRGPIVMGINTEGVYEKYMGKRPGEHLRGVQDPPAAFSRELTAMVKAIEAGRKARGWPEFLYYPIDEPSTEPVAVRFMVTVLKACKAAGVRTYVTADPTHEGFAPLRPYVDVWCTQPFAPDRETVLADMKARHVEYWCYPNHVNGENDHTPVAGARMTYGFGFWRSGFRALIPWIYSYSVGDPMNYLDGPLMDFFNRHEPDGTPVSVTLWEAYREGYDDGRYIDTLEQLITAAKKSPKAGARNAAASAEKELRSVWDAIRVQPKYRYDNLWAPEEFDVYRWMIARQILAVQSADARRHP